MECVVGQVVPDVLKVRGAFAVALDLRIKGL
jgi:hypothetical protein